MKQRKVSYAVVVASKRPNWEPVTVNPRTRRHEPYGDQRLTVASRKDDRGRHSSHRAPIHCLNSLLKLPCELVLAWVI